MRFRAEVFDPRHDTDGVAAGGERFHQQTVGFVAAAVGGIVERVVRKEDAERLSGGFQTREHALEVACRRASQQTAVRPRATAAASPSQAARSVSRVRSAASHGSMFCGASSGRGMAFRRRPVVALDGVHRNYVAGALLASMRPPESLATTGMPRSIALHHDQAEAFVPERRHQQHARLRQYVVDIARVRQMRTFGRCASALPVGGGGAPSAAPRRTHAPGSRSATFRKIEMPLTSHGLIMSDQAASKIARLAKGRCAVDRRMDHRRGGPLQLASMYSAMCRPMATIRGGAADQVRGMAVGMVQLPGRTGRTAECAQDRRRRPARTACASRSRPWPRSSEETSTQSGAKARISFLKELGVAREVASRSRISMPLRGGVVCVAVACGDDAAGVAGGGERFEPYEVAARGSSARRVVGGVGGEKKFHAGPLPYGRGSLSRRSTSSSLNCSI